MQTAATHADLVSTGMDAETEIELLARAEHLQLLFRHGLIVLLSNLSAGIALVGGLWPYLPHGELLAWLGVLALVNTVRWGLSRRFGSESIDIARVPSREAALIGGTLASAVLWGAAAVLFYVPDEPALAMFLALILVAMTAASTVLLSFHRIAYPLFCIPIVIPLAVQLVADPGSLQTAIAIVIPIYYALLFILSREIYRYSHEAIVTGSVRERHALLDHVTSIPNRRAFDEFLHAEWMRAARNGQPLSLILCDVDRFKRYNDEYGHAVGDAVLRAVAGLCRQEARRKTDMAARIGGDEFAIIAADTNADGAARIVRNLERSREVAARRSVQPWAFPTLSVGCFTSIPTGAASASSVFEQADAALYRAKAEMRRRELDEPIG